MDRRCTEEIFELSNFSICSPSLAPQISAARNSFKHDKDYYEGLLEYYRHSSSIQLSRFILLHILKWNYRFDMFVTPLSPDFALLFLVPLVGNIWNKPSVCWCLQSYSLHNLYTLSSEGARRCQLVATLKMYVVGAAARRVWTRAGNVGSQSLKFHNHRPLLDPSPGWKRLLVLSHNVLLVS